MKCLKKSLMICVLVTPLMARADTACHVQMGILSCEQGRMAELPGGFFNYTSLNEVRVTKSTNINAAKISTKRSSLNNINFSAGEITIQKSLLKGDIDVTAGSIGLQDSVLRQDANFSSPRLDIDHCITDGINIGSDSDKPLCVNITKNSTVNGDVVFNESNGKVYLDKSSIIHGAVKGGQLITQSCDLV